MRVSRLSRGATTTPQRRDVRATDRRCTPAQTACSVGSTAGRDGQGTSRDIAGQRHHEPGPAGVAVFHVRGAAVELGEALHERQADAHAAAARVLPLTERFEQRRLQLVGDAGSVVLDGQHDTVGPRRDPHVHRRCPAGVWRAALINRLSITRSTLPGSTSTSTRSASIRTGWPSSCPALGDDGLGERADVGGLTLGVQLAAVDAIEVQQVVDQSIHLEAALLDHLVQALALVVGEVQLGRRGGSSASRPGCRRAAPSGRATPRAAACPSRRSSRAGRWNARTRASTRSHCASMIERSVSSSIAKARNTANRTIAFQYGTGPVPAAAWTARPSTMPATVAMTTETAPHRRPRFHVTSPIGIR